MADQPTAESLLKALVTAVNSAHISSWQTTAGWQKELDEAGMWLECCTVEGLQQQVKDLQAMYNAQCQATDEWHEAFLAERAAKSPERIAELEQQLAEMNQRYADLQEAMDRMAPYEGSAT